MASLFKVRVEELTSTTCNLRLFIVHPDQRRFYATTSFALQLLWEPTHPIYEIDSSLSQFISLEQITSTEYVLENQDRFISLVEFVEFVNYPVNVDFESMDAEEMKAYFSDESRLPQAVIRIGVTEPRWLEHLKVGMEWESAAYNM